MAHERKTIHCDKYHTTKNQKSPRASKKFRSPGAMGVFASKSTPKTDGKRPVDQSNQMTNIDKAKLEVKRGKNRIAKHSKKLEQQCVKLDQDARMYLKAGKKKKALYTLKLKRLKIKSIENVEKQILSLEKVLVEIETTEMTQESLKAVQSGTDALNEMHRIMSVEDVEQIMADNEDALDDANEIASLISNSSSNLDELDDDELAAELAALEGPQTRIAIESDTEKQINSMPQVPTNSIVIQQNQNQKNSESPSQERVLLTA